MLFVGGHKYVYVYNTIPTICPSVLFWMMLTYYGDHYNYCGNIYKLSHKEIQRQFCGNNKSVVMKRSFEVKFAEYIKWVYIYFDSFYVVN